MRIIKISIIILLVTFVGIQFIPKTRNQSKIVLKSDFLSVNKVPKTLERKIRVSCYDCHSNNTEYPWYNKIQLISWYLEKHVEEGKYELNFNEWGNYSSRKKRSKLRSIKSQIENDKMPLSSYTLLHREAILNEEEKQMFLAWLDTLDIP
ncbi:heme-binding domain-containing protein [Sinomicrobium weinanense]|uniref:Heme-binding domain-containing protein n=1 Tax=Sinomicrobium weinanense TaxID=2842200 RepID=A0A926Q313_9FLAO|nr:heme-binding domain-containing protein [Sinomicrobium weinanense]MBC9795265.1 heme-binding domain-containing protein [Sinomicrobium weinanense]MBU3125737.1 heme-binding domain-containing protein [Sinomicrobium weinanense]